MNRNVKYGIVGIALVGAIAIAFNGWDERLHHAPIKEDVKMQ